MSSIRGTAALDDRSPEPLIGDAIYLDGGADYGVVEVTGREVAIRLSVSV